MTNEKFENYLQSIDGLINGNYPDRPAIIERGFFEVNDGWLELIKNLIQELIAAGWNKEICQVKEKFAGLRFYINESSEKINKIILKYKMLSYQTCEVCGSTENVTQTKGRWIVSVCEKHIKILKKF